MQLTNISYSQPSAACLLELINFDNNQTFLTTDLAFSDPAIGLSPTETHVNVSPGVTSGLTGVVPVDYHRLDIAVFFSGATPALYIPGTPTAQLVRNALLDQFQIYTASDDYNLFNVTISTDLKTATIVPGPKNYVWVGTLTAAINNLPVLASLITVPTLPGFALPANQSSSCPNAQVFYGLVNGTSLVNELQALRSGDTFSQYLNTWLIGTQLLGEAWYANQTPGPWNLYGSRVEYNGISVGTYSVPTSNGNWPGWVLVIDLGIACTNRCGKLIFVYTPNTMGGGAPPPTPTPGNLLYN
jgi:hypothetical protein